MPWSDRLLTRLGDFSTRHAGAVVIANKIVRQQNRKLFKEIMNYLLKAKFLIGMTEIKLTRVLKKKIFGLMKKNAGITEDNV